MRKQAAILSTIIVGGALVGGAWIVHAQEPGLGERDQVRRLIDEAERLESEGKREEARGLTQQAERLLRESSGANEPPPRRDPPQPDGMARIRHLRAAQEHLQAAGFPDMADHVRRKADELEADLRRSGERRPEGEGGELGREVRDVVREVREAIRSLREEVSQQRRQLDEFRRDVHRRFESERPDRPRE